MQPVSTALSGAIDAIKIRASSPTGTAISKHTSEELRMFGELIAIADLSTPTEVDNALVVLLTSQLGLSIILETSNDWSGNHPYRRDIRKLVVDSPSLAASQNALRCMTIAETPATDEQAVGWLATLRTMVKARASSDFEYEITLHAYCEKLRNFPADIVQHVLRTWPDNSEWWPCWHELLECLTDAFQIRSTLKHRIAKSLNQ
jgi:hypothetical protein